MQEINYQTEKKRNTLVKVFRNEAYFVLGLATLIAIGGGYLTLTMISMFLDFNVKVALGYFLIIAIGFIVIAIEYYIHTVKFILNEDQIEILYKKTKPLIKESDEE
ncbi:hypothetical protein [Acinetobacter sp. P1(2025)]|uniref:hypothetical protein n=1 Tax=Acinetobacter sp. P1(2025) TaxID=3446120 RepID=UPI003F5329FF